MMDSHGQQRQQQRQETSGVHPAAVETLGSRFNEPQWMRADH